MNAEAIVTELRDRLVKYRGRYLEILERSPELDYSWLSKFVNGKIPNPTIGKLSALSNLLDELEKDAAA